LLRWAEGFGLERGVYLDENFAFGGGGDRVPSCCACKQPIREGERSIRVEFRTDPKGTEGLTGEYHLACGKPFASLARVVNMDIWGGH
jgi:hypothetical protein